MRNNEKIFSLGDLEEPREEYEDFIESEYSGDLKERYSHVQEMILRLNIELLILRDEIYPPGPF